MALRISRPGADNGRRHIFDEVVWAFAGTVVLTGILRTGQATGVTRMDLPLMLGTMLTPNRDRAKVYGTLVHALNGWLLGGAYVAMFHSLRRASLLIGALIGLAHGLFVLVAVLPVLPGVHPRMASDSMGPQPTNALEPPGFLGLNYGRRTPVATLIAHVIYGAILGHFYETSSNREREGWRRVLPRPSDHLDAESDLAALGLRDR